MHAETLKLILEASMMLIVFGIGLEGSVQDLTSIRRHPILVLRSLIAVNVVVPLAAILLCLIVPLPQPTRAGIVLMGVSPLCPIVLGKMLKSGAQRRYVVGVYVCLVLASVLLVPLTVELLGRGLDRDYHAPVAHIIRLTLSTIALPLGAGMLIASVVPGLAKRAARIVGIVGTLLFLPIVALVLYRAGPQMLALIGNGTLAVIVLTLFTGFVAGHLLGGPKPPCQIALAQAATTRHPAMAGLIAAMNFEDRDVMLAILLFLFTGMAMSLLYAAWMKRRMYH